MLFVCYIVICLSRGFIESHLSTSCVHFTQPPLDGKDSSKELSDVNLFSFMLHAATFHRHVIRSATMNELNGRPPRVTFHRHIIRFATTNELNGRPSRVSERLAKASHLEKNCGGNAVES